MTLRFGAIGLDHRHIYHMIAENVAAGAVCAGYCPDSNDPLVLDGVRQRFPDLPEVPRARLLDDPSVDFVVIAAKPCDRADLAICAMRAGKDVMVDKPGAITAADADAIERVAAETGRIWSVCFSERFMVRACERASRLVAGGAIGQVIHVAGMGPHRLNRPTRPRWFFDPRQAGGILADIASHQIDQVLHYTGADGADLVSSTVANRAHPDLPRFQDYGEILLRTEGATAFIRVDWFTPDGLPAWGDGRLFLLGTHGTIELRKYVDPAGRPGGDHLILCDAEGVRHLDCTDEALTYFRAFQDDLHDRRETAMLPGHALRVTRLAIEAQARAIRA